MTIEYGPVMDSDGQEIKWQIRNPIHCIHDMLWQQMNYMC